MNWKVLNAVMISLVLLVAGSCDKIKKLVNIDVPLTMEYELTIPAAPLADEFDIPPIDINANVRQKTEEYTDKSGGFGQVQSVYLNSVTLSVNEDNRFEDDNLTSLSKIVVDMKSSSKAEWINLVRMTTPPLQPFVETLPVDTETNFKDYFLSDIFTYKGQLGLARPVSREIRCTMTISVTINVSL